MTRDQVSNRRSDRRQFLKLSSAVAVSAVGSRPAWSATPLERRKVRVGIVGGGNFGLAFQFHEHPNCTVQAVSDLLPDRRKKLQEVYQCERSYDSLEQLVQATDIDAVAIFTDGPLHVDHVTKAMRAGKHALSAVPAAWGSLEEIERLLEVVKSTGLTYMLAETSYYQQSTISARQFYEKGQFGELFYTQSGYQHDGLEQLYIADGQRTWRYGMAPMHYPTHCTSHLVSVTKHRLTEVVCHGWGDDSEILRDNVYGNPFWNESAHFKTSADTSFDCHIWWKGAHRGSERAEWVGSLMSFYGAHPHGTGPVIIRRSQQSETDDAGFVRNLPTLEPYAQPQYWTTDLLPGPLRHNSGHEGSHSFITHEFIDAIYNDRRPEIDVYEAVAYTAPGIVAHESALRGGELMKIPQYDPTPVAKRKGLTRP